MDEMILNQNDHGIFFEDYEIQWTLNGDDVSYEEVLLALSSDKKIESISVGSPGDSYYYCETDELQWDLQWDVSIDLNYNKKYALQTYIYASPYNAVDWLDELQDEHDDFDEVAENIIERLEKQGYHLFPGDVYAELEGDYSRMRNKEYDSIKEAFEVIPRAFDAIFSYMEAKDVFIAELLEYYEE